MVLNELKHSLRYYLYFMNKFKNTDLQIAKRDKIDEFYTQLADIEKELKFYTKHFEK